MIIDSWLEYVIAITVILSAWVIVVKMLEKKE